MTVPPENVPSTLDVLILAELNAAARPLGARALMAALQKSAAQNQFREPLPSSAQLSVRLLKSGWLRDRTARSAGYRWRCLGTESESTAKRTPPSEKLKPETSSIPLRGAPLAAAIFEQLVLQPGSSAKTIATELKVERKVVNALLYGQLASHIEKRNGKEWFLKRLEPAPTTMRPTEVSDRLRPGPVGVLRDGARQILRVIGEFPRSKASLIRESGIKPSQWSAAVRSLIAEEHVVKSGPRSAREYELASAEFFAMRAALDDTARRKSNLVERSKIVAAYWGYTIQLMIRTGNAERIGHGGASKYIRIYSKGPTSQTNRMVAAVATLAEFPKDDVSFDDIKYEGQDDHRRAAGLLLTAIDEQPRGRAELVRKTGLNLESWGTSIETLLSEKRIVRIGKRGGAMYVSATASPAQFTPLSLVASAASTNHNNANPTPRGSKPQPTDGTSLSRASQRLLECMNSVPQGRSALLRLSGVDSELWPPSVQLLISQGEIIQTGARRSAMYALTEASSPTPNNNMSNKNKNHISTPKTSHQQTPLTLHAVKSLPKILSDTWLNFSELSREEQRACFAVFYAMADIDGEVHPAEVATIQSTLARESVHESLQQEIDSFEQLTPHFENNLNQLAESSYPLRCAVLAQLMEIADSDGVLAPEELTGIVFARRRLDVRPFHAAAIRETLVEFRRHRRTQQLLSVEDLAIEAAVVKAAGRGVPRCAFYFQVGPSTDGKMSRSEHVPESDSETQKMVARVMQRRQLNQRRTLLKRLDDRGFDDPTI